MNCTDELHERLLTDNLTLYWGIIFSYFGSVALFDFDLFEKDFHCAIGLGKVGFLKLIMKMWFV